MMTAAVHAPDGLSRDERQEDALALRPDPRTRDAGTDRLTARARGRDLDLFDLDPIDRDAADDTVRCRVMP
jgi:hypothetical protein